MSLIEDADVPTTVPDLTGRYDSFKFASHFTKLEIGLPKCFLEIGTAKGIRFERAKWDRVQEAVISAVKGMPEFMLALGYFEGLVVVGQKPASASSGSASFRVKANKPDLNAYSGNGALASYKRDMATYKSLPKAPAGAPAVAQTTLYVDPSKSSEAVTAVYLRELGQIMAAKFLPVLGDQLKVHEKIRPLFSEPSKLAKLEFPQLYKELKLMAAGSQGQAVGDLSTRWANLVLVGGTDGVDEFLLAIKKISSQFIFHCLKNYTL